MRVTALTRSLSAALLILFGLAAAAVPQISAADTRDAAQQRVSASRDVLHQLIGMPDRGAPDWLLARAQGIAVIPGVIKIGFIVGGRRGHGLLFVRGKHGRWSDGSFITLTSGSIGWQIGAQSTDVVLVFTTPQSIRGIRKGQFTLGADASVAAGPVGRSASAGTNVKLRAEVYSYSRSRGLFAGVSLDGGALQIDHKTNRAYYGNDTSTDRILATPPLKAPAAMKRLRDMLDRYAPTKAQQKAPD